MKEILINHELLMAQALNDAIDDILITLKSVEYASYYLKSLIKPDIYRYTYGYRCYIKGIFEISAEINYETYSDFLDIINLVEEEAEECFGYPVLDYFS